MGDNYPEPLLSTIHTLIVYKEIDTEWALGVPADMTNIERCSKLYPRGRSANIEWFYAFLHVD